MLTAMLNNERLTLKPGSTTATLLDEDAFMSLAGCGDLRCANCNGRIHARRLWVPEGERWTIRKATFAHNPGEAEKCRMLGGGESAEHEALKHAIADHAHRNGLPVDVEVMHADRCRSDVVIGSGDDRTGVEIQLSASTVADAMARHERYAEALGGTRSVLWLTKGWRPWGDVCRAHIEEQEDGQWLVAAKVYTAWPKPARTQHQAAPEFALRRAKRRVDWIMLEDDSHWVDRDEMRVDARAQAPRSKPARRSHDDDIDYRTEDCERITPFAQQHTPPPPMRPEAPPALGMTACDQCGAHYRDEHILCAGKPWRSYIGEVVA